MQSPSPMSALLQIIITLSLITTSLCLVVATVMQGDLLAETEMPPASRAGLTDDVTFHFDGEKRLLF